MSESVFRVPVVRASHTFAGHSKRVPACTVLWPWYKHHGWLGVKAQFPFHWRDSRHSHSLACESQVNNKQKQKKALTWFWFFCCWLLRWSYTEQCFLPSVNLILFAVIWFVWETGDFVKTANATNIPGMKHCICRPWHHILHHEDIQCSHGSMPSWGHCV